MRRLITIVTALSMVSPALAQIDSPQQPDSEKPQRISATLKAASSAQPTTSSSVLRSQPEPSENVQAPGIVTCEHLRAEIDRKIRANGVPRFSLEVMPTAQVESLMAEKPDHHDLGEIVGSCGGGSYKILYRRG